MLFEGCGDGGFSGRGQAGEPDCEAALFAVAVALAAVEASLWWGNSGGAAAEVWRPPKSAVCAVHVFPRFRLRASLTRRLEPFSHVSMNRSTWTMIY